MKIRGKIPSRKELKKSMARALRAFEKSAGRYKKTQAKAFATFLLTFTPSFRDSIR